MCDFKKYIFTALVLCGLLYLQAGADDVVSPPWRGVEGTTYQEWRFDSNNNPALPEVINNPYGNANAVIVVDFFGSGWLDQLPGLGNQTGYWDIGGQDGKITVNIDNLPAMPRKEIWIQVTYFQDITAPPIVNVSGAQYISGQKILLYHVSTGGDWFVDQSIWRINPSPSSEQIIFTSNPSWGAIIDQIIVDTYCRACIVDFDDLSMFTEQWLLEGADLDADFDGNNKVDFSDFAFLASLWMQPCPSGWPW